MRTQNEHKWRRDRLGATLIGILACMVVCTSLATLALQSALRGRQSARIAHQREQVQWLCEAGTLRAIERLSRDPQFRGETWRPKLNLPTYSAAEVEIQVEPAAADSTDSGEDKYTIRIQSRVEAITQSFGPLQKTSQFQYTTSKP